MNNDVLAVLRNCSEQDALEAVNALLCAHKQGTVIGDALLDSALVIDDHLNNVAPTYDDIAAFHAATRRAAANQDHAPMLRVLSQA